VWLSKPHTSRHTRAHARAHAWAAPAAVQGNLPQKNRTESNTDHCAVGAVARVRRAQGKGSDVRKAGGARAGTSVKGKHQPFKFHPRPRLHPEGRAEEREDVRMQPAMQGHRGGQAPGVHARGQQGARAQRRTRKKDTEEGSRQRQSIKAEPTGEPTGRDWDEIEAEPIGEPTGRNWAGVARGSRALGP